MRRGITICADILRTTKQKKYAYFLFHECRNHPIDSAFLSEITEKSLNVFYYACSYAKVDYSRFMNTTVRIVLKLIPDSLQTQPVFLCVDDTMVSKFGTKFENVSKLFDHAAHNGSNYLNGHCFVSIMLCIPVWKNDRVSYLSLPLGYRMWQKKAPLNQTGSDRMKYIPLFLYSFRWNIETSYYEQKTIWSLCSYMVRSCKGIEMLVNLINICYCAMKILPYQDEQFSEYRTKSVQEFRFELSQGIRSQIFFATFVKNIETHIKSETMINFTNYNSSSSIKSINNLITGFVLFGFVTHT